jgi:hypothetical protein
LLPKQGTNANITTMAPTPAMETTASELGTAHGAQQQQMTTTQLQMPTTQQLQQIWLMLQ